MDWKKGQKLYTIVYFFLLFMSAIWVPVSIGFANGDLGMEFLRAVLYAVVFFGVALFILLSGTEHMQRDPWTWVCVTYFLFHVWILDATIWPSTLVN